MTEEDYKKLIRDLNRINARLNILKSNVLNLKEKQKNAIVLNGKTYQRDSIIKVYNEIGEVQSKIRDNIIYSLKEKI